MKEAVMAQEKDMSRELREIPMWARHYAQNRTLPTVLALIAFTLGFGVFVGLGFLVPWAFRNGHRLVGGVAAATLVGFSIWWIWFSFVGARRWMAHLQQRVYSGEGSGSPASGASCPSGRLGTWPGVLLAACIAATVVLTAVGLLPERYMQPATAVFLVPFLAYVLFVQRAAASPFMMLWPLLYAAHAVLIVVGAPIYIEGPWGFLNMVIPTMGYGLLAALIAHAYSRYALRRLRRLAAGSEDSADE